MTLMQEFHADHQKVVGALFELRQAIAALDITRVRSILEDAEGLIGPHFKFEELYLYPALEQFLGESHVKRLVNEHDGIFRSVRRIAQLAQKEAWSDSDRASAEANLELIYEHPIGCDGLTLWMERLSPTEQQELDDRMQEIRRQGTKFSEYYLERQNA
ncbi:MAG: hemerythrin domain-containing protein [Bryobacteraceae bacterium]|nr:hemerythrin domain-containing protein [Bryobacteraceae bacterium]